MILCSGVLEYLPAHDIIMAHRKNKELLDHGLAMFANQL